MPHDYLNLMFSQREERNGCQEFTLAAGEKQREQRLNR